MSDVVRTMPQTLQDLQRELYDTALARQRDSMQEVSDADNIGDAGTWMVPWSALGPQGEARLAERGYTVRCLVTADGDVPAAVAPDQRDDHTDDDLLAWVAKAY